jgi:hypothetical protein
VLLLCLGLVLGLLGLLGRSPLASVSFTLDRIQRGIVAVIGAGLAVWGLVLLIPPPPRFAIGGTIVESGSGAPVAGAVVEAHDDATSDKPANQAETDDAGKFYLNYGQDDEGRYVRLRVVKQNFGVLTHYALVKPRSDALKLQLVARASGRELATSQPAPAPAPLPPSQAALDFSPLRSGELVVWRSTRPEYYSTAIGSAYARDFPAGKLIERDIPREQFVAVAQKPPANDPPPDLAFIDNYQELKPIEDAKIVWMVWGTPRFATRGWWVIFKNTKHLAQAQAFARWLNRAPGWQPRAKNISISEDSIRTVQNASIAALQAWMGSDQAALEALLDREAARTRPTAPAPGAAINDVQPILTFGNSRIAFVLLAVAASGDDFYGMRHMIFLFRKQGSGWRILFLSTDARMPDAEGLQGIEANPTLLRNFDSLITTDAATPPPPPAVLVGPPDRAELPRFPQPPDIVWQSDATAGASFIIEAQFANPGDEANWSASYLTFATASREGQTFRETAPFGVGKQPHRWRIWTLDSSGAISLSPWRTLIHSN